MGIQRQDLRKIIDGENIPETLRTSLEHIVNFSNEEQIPGILLEIIFMFNEEKELILEKLKYAEANRTHPKDILLVRGEFVDKSVNDPSYDEPGIS